MPSRFLPLLACLAAASCASSSARPAVPPCEAPVALPDRALDDREIEVLWGRDRDALRTCGARLDALIGGK